MPREDDEFEVRSRLRTGVEWTRRSWGKVGGKVRAAGLVRKLRSVEGKKEGKREKGRPARTR